MIDRRKIMLASLAGVLLPVCAVFAQPAPEERKAEPSADHGADQPHEEDHGSDRTTGHAPAEAHPVQAHPAEHAAAARPHMPPLRHEVRPRPPGPEASYHWRDGHWTWDGRKWVWVSGVWYR